MGDYTETAIPIEGFKLVSKGSYTVALTEEKHEWLIVFKYQKADKDKEEPVNPIDPDNPDKEEPVNPIDPDNPDKEQPKAPDKEEVKQPEKPKTDAPKVTDSKNKDKTITTRGKLPKTGSTTTALYLVGGLASLSGGMILRKKK